MIVRGCGRHLGIRSIRGECFVLGVGFVEIGRWRVELFGRWCRGGFGVVLIVGRDSSLLRLISRIRMMMMVVRIGRRWWGVVGCSVWRCDFFVMGSSLWDAVG